jgi:hypothetical protein
MRHLKADKYVLEGLQASSGIFMDSEQLTSSDLTSLEDYLQFSHAYHYDRESQTAGFYAPGRPASRRVTH